MTINAAQLIEQYIKLRTKVEATSKVHEQELAPYKAAMATIENAVSALLTESGADNIKTEFGTAYRSEILSVRMADRQAFMQFIADDFGEREGFLTSAVSKDVVKDYIEQNKSVPPGLDLTTIFKTNFRKPT